VGARTRGYVLGVAGCHRYDRGVYFDELAARLLMTPTAVLAEGQRHLIARAALVRGSAKDLTRHEQQRRVIIERTFALTP
jgi:hypothetical protein